MNRDQVIPDKKTGPRSIARPESRLGIIHMIAERNGPAQESKISPETPIKATRKSKVFGTSE